VATILFFIFNFPYLFDECSRCSCTEAAAAAATNQNFIDTIDTISRYFKTEQGMELLLFLFEECISSLISFIFIIFNIQTIYCDSVDDAEGYLADIEDFDPDDPKDDCFATHRSPSVTDSDTDDDSSREAAASDNDTEYSEFTVRQTSQESDQE
jgi:hypothetical protein